MVFLFVQTFPIFVAFYGIPAAPEVFKNLPGARGIIFPKSRSIPSHGDPIHPKYYHFYKFL